MPPAKKARIEVEVDLEDRVSTDLVCPCNAAHVYKNAEGFEKHKNSKTHIAFEKWKKNYDHTEQKNNKILLNEQDAKISTLGAELRREQERAQSHFNQCQVVQCYLQQVHKQCVDCLNHFAYDPQVLQFFPQHAVFQQQWYQEWTPCPPSDPPPPPPEYPPVA